MKWFIPVSALLAATALCADAAPQGYGGGSRRPSKQKQCCRTFFDVTYEDKYDTVCTDTYERKCSTLYRNKCEPYQDKVCKTVNRRQCDKKQKQECRQEYRTEYEPYSEQVCKDTWENKCEGDWVESYGRKEWVEDPTRCNRYKTTKCDQVQRQREKRVPYQKCDYKEYDDCYNVPEEKCDYVSKQRCNREPYQDCKDVPKKDCKEQHRRVPKQVSKRVCSGDKDWNRRFGSDDYDYQEDCDDDFVDDVHGGGNTGNRNDPYSATGVSNAFVQQSSSGNNGNRNVQRPSRVRPGAGSGSNFGIRTAGGNRGGEDDDKVYFGKK